MTIYDIAKLAGVSKSTVSRVLNGESNVSQSARERVEAVIKETNYVPNRNAAMTKKKREVILVLVTRLDSHSESRLVRGMMEQASSEVEFLITETQFDIEQTKKIIEHNKNVNAMVIFAISGQDYSFIESLLIPVVVIGQQIQTTKHNIYFPDYDGMKALIKSSNLKNPLFLGYDPKDKTMITRYEAACEECGFELPKVEVTSYGHLADIDLHAIKKYSSFICATDTIALNCYKYILQAQLTNYEILSIGNNQQINFIIDRLTTVDFHYKSTGRYIIDNLKNKKRIDYVSNYSLVRVNN